MLQWKLLVKSTLSLILSDSFLSEVRTEHLGSTQHFDKKYEPINKENNKSQHGFKAAYKTSTTRIDILNENSKLTVKYTPLELYKQKSDDDLSFF